MNRLTSIGEWSFEVTQIRARKTAVFGEPYSAVATITITDGMPHVEGLLSKDKFTKTDHKAIAEFMRVLGFEHYEYSRFKFSNKNIRKGRV